MVLMFTSAVSKLGVREISFSFGWFPPADKIPHCSAFFPCLQFLQIQLKPIFSKSTTCSMVLMFTSAVSKLGVREISFAFGWFPPALRSLAE